MNHKAVRAPHATPVQFDAYLRDMKYVLLRPTAFLSSLVFSLLSTFSVLANPVPNDTLVGHARMLHIISAALCSKLEAESKRTDFKQLTPHQSDKLLEGLTFQTVGEHLKEIEVMLATVSRRKGKQYGQQLGREALLKMADECVAARTFLPDLNYEATADKSPVTEAEKIVLQTIARTSCQGLADEDARQPFESRTPQERNAAIGQIIQSSLFINTPELMRYYGEGIMTDQKRYGDVVERMSLFMLSSCPKYPLMLSLHPVKQ